MSRFPTMPMTTAGSWASVSSSRTFCRPAEHRDVPLEVLRAEPVVDALVGPLEHRPEALDPVGVDGRSLQIPDVLGGAVPDRLVLPPR